MSFRRHDDVASRRAVADGDARSAAAADQVAGVADGQRSRRTRILIHVDVVDVGFGLAGVSGQRCDSDIDRRRTARCRTGTKVAARFQTQRVSDDEIIRCRLPDIASRSNIGIVVRAHRGVQIDLIDRCRRARCQNDDVEFFVVARVPGDDVLIDADVTVRRNQRHCSVGRCQTAERIDRSDCQTVSFSDEHSAAG